MALSKIRNDSLADTAFHGRRNIIINGAMQVAQRGTSVTSVSTYGIKTVDRFNFSTGGSPSSVYTLTQESDAPDGFEKSLKYNCTTADTSFTGSEQNTMEYRFERSDLQRLQHGTSGAKPITLSFWVKSNVTGDYAVWFYKNETQDRITNKVYTINSADTWEYKTLEISGDTDADGAIATGSTYGMIIRWVLSSGSDFTSGTSPDGSWEDYTSANSYAGHAVNLASATGNTWQITGIQLEVGDTATPFEHRSYGEELALCQRYYCKSYAMNKYAGATDDNDNQCTLARINSTVSNRTVENAKFPVRMRTKPTVTLYSLNGTSGSISDTGTSSGTHSRDEGVTLNRYGETGIAWFSNVNSFTAGDGGAFHFTADAEL